MNEIEKILMKLNFRLQFAENYPLVVTIWASAFGEFIRLTDALNSHEFDSYFSRAYPAIVTDDNINVDDFMSAKVDAFLELNMPEWERIMANASQADIPSLDEHMEVLNYAVMIMTIAWATIKPRLTKEQEFRKEQDNNPRGMKVGTPERVREMHFMLKQGKSQRQAKTQAHCDPSTYYKWCKVVTSEEPIVPYR